MRVAGLNCGCFDRMPAESEVSITSLKGGKPELVIDDIPVKVLMVTRKNKSPDTNTTIT